MPLNDIYNVVNFLMDVYKFQMIVTASGISFYTYTNPTTTFITKASNYIFFNTTDGSMSFIHDWHRASSFFAFKVYHQLSFTIHHNGLNNTNRNGSALFINHSHTHPCARTVLPALTLEESLCCSTNHKREEFMQE